MYSLFIFKQLYCTPVVFYIQRGNVYYCVNIESIVTSTMAAKLMPSFCLGYVSKGDLLFSTLNMMVKFIATYTLRKLITIVTPKKHITLT